MEKVPMLSVAESRRKLIYPHSITELETAIREHSLRHNREVYPGQPNNNANIQIKSETQEKNKKTKSFR